MSIAYLPFHVQRMAYWIERESVKYHGDHIDEQNSTALAHAPRTAARFSPSAETEQALTHWPMRKPPRVKITKMAKNTKNVVV